MTIQQQFRLHDSKRQESLLLARKCAAVTLPFVLPPEGHTKDTRLPDTWQSLGAELVTNWAGTVTSSVFPAQVPFFALEADESILAGATPEQRTELEYALFVIRSVLAGMIESTVLKPLDNRRPQGFRSQMHLNSLQLGVTGDTYFRLDEDVRVTVFRRDNYVQVRDSYGDILTAIFRENIDIAEAPDLAKEAWQRKNSDLDIETAPYEKRMVDIYTQVRWVQSKKKWEIRQEIEGVEVIEPAYQEVCEYINVPHMVLPGESYGRGVVEQNLADLNSYNGLSKSLLEHAGMASTLLIFKDVASLVRDEDLVKRAGSIVSAARVEGGKLMDIAGWAPEHVPSFEVAYRAMMDLRENISRRFLYLPGQVRDSERTTAAEVTNVTLANAEGSRGPVYTPIADSLQIPVLQRMMVIAEKKGVLKSILPSWVKENTKIRLLTGAAALARQQRVTSVVQAMTLIRDLSANPLPDVIDADALYREIVNQFNISQNIVRSPAQVAQIRNEQQQREQMQMAMEAAAPEVAAAVANPTQNASLPVAQR